MGLGYIVYGRLCPYPTTHTFASKTKVEHLRSTDHSDIRVASARFSYWCWVLPLPWSPLEYCRWKIKKIIHMFSFKTLPQIAIWIFLIWLHLRGVCEENYVWFVVITWWWVLYSCRNSLLRKKSPCFDRKSPSGYSCCWTYPIYKIFRTKIAIKWSVYKLCK